MQHEVFRTPAYSEVVDRVAALPFIPWRELESKTVLVTGASGLIGSHLIDVLLRRNRNVTNIKVVAGGATGQESIRNGLNEIAQSCPQDAVVLIHDDNRPMVDNNVISDSLSVFREHGSAVAVIPCTEVVFKSENDSESLDEIPRELLYRTQTPHTYALGKLLWACDQARQRSLSGMAAMCQLMSRLGETTYFSKGSEKNLKLTTMDDMEIFKALLSVEKSGRERT